MYGKGIYNFQNGRRYEGQWFNGLKQGFGMSCRSVCLAHCELGVYYWPSEEYYVGMMFQDCLDG